MSESYGVPHEIRGRTGCFASIGAVIAAIAAAGFGYGLVAGAFSAHGAVTWIVPVIFAVGAFLGVRRWSANRRSFIAFACPYCGVETDPDFLTCAACGRDKA